MKHSLIELYIKWKNTLKDGGDFSIEKFFINYESKSKTYKNAISELNKAKSISHNISGFFEKLFFIVIVTSPLFLINYFFEFISNYYLFFIEVVLTFIFQILYSITDYHYSKSIVDKHKNFLQKNEGVFFSDLTTQLISESLSEIQKFSDLKRRGEEFKNFKLNTVAQSYDIHDIIFFYSFLEYFCSKNISDQDIRELIHIKESQINELNSQIKFFTGNT